MGAFINNNTANMNKFDKTVKSIMESFKLLKESFEYNHEFFEDKFSIPVADIIPGDTSDDLFLLWGKTTTEYGISPGGGDDWNEPRYDPEVEVDNIIWDEIQLMRDPAETETDYRGQTYDYDKETTLVTPESIGQEYYDKAVKILKTRAEEYIVKDVDENGIEKASQSF